MTQRRLDLAVMEEHELRRLQERFVVARRLAYEMGAATSELAKWSQYISEINEEFSCRNSEDVPF